MKLYKFRSLTEFDRVLDIVVMQQLYCARYDKLNDPFEGLLRTRIAGSGSKDGFPYTLPIVFGVSSKDLVRDTEIGELKPKYKSVNICSLSRSIGDVRMWSLYADGFKGVAIEVEIEEDDPKLHIVDYMKSPPEYPSSNILAEQVLTKKTIHWEYESEARIITEKPFYSVEGRVSAIHVGIRISDLHIKMLRTLNLGVPIYETLLDKENVKVISKQRTN